MSEENLRRFAEGPEWGRVREAVHQGELESFEIAIRALREVFGEPTPQQKKAARQFWLGESPNE